MKTSTRRGITGVILLSALLIAMASRRHHLFAAKLLATPIAANIHAVHPSFGPAQLIVAGARSQLGTVYDPAYFDIAYPNGDVPHDRGACTDVVIRALRWAGFDLQRLIHEDMKRDFSAYPHQWGLRYTDTNIDHRRVPNQMVFFKRHGLALTREVSPRTLHTWLPGDIVCWKLDNGLDHCGVLSDRRNAQGRPFVIHNLATCVEEDCLTAWKISGHFRYPK